MPVQHNVGGDEGILLTGYTQQSTNKDILQEHASSFVSN